MAVRQMVSKRQLKASTWTMRRMEMNSGSRGSFKQQLDGGGFFKRDWLHEGGLLVDASYPDKDHYAKYQ